MSKEEGMGRGDTGAQQLTAFPICQYYGQKDHSYIQGQGLEYFSVEGYVLVGSGLEQGNMLVEGGYEKVQK